MQNYIQLDDLEVYKLSKKLSELSWVIYKKLDWQNKKIVGDQFIRSVDSVGANIAEGYGRFHYLDKVKFYYNARGSLLESRHWSNLLQQRGIINQENNNELVDIIFNILNGLNGLIRANCEQKRN